jgi:hypothetical protein
MFSSSKKDSRYFISRTQYNCPYCLTSAVRFEVIDTFDFNWSDGETRRCILVQCQEPNCENISLHMSKHNVTGYNGDLNLPWVKITNPETQKEESVAWEKVHSIDEAFFYHHPNSSFVIDDRIPNKIKNLLDEASTCHKMGLLTGASACLRKAIFEILAHFNIPKTKTDKEKIEHIDYFDRLDLLKTEILKKVPGVDTSLFSDIKKIYSLTSEPLHEKLPHEIEWKPLTGDQFKFLAGVLHDLLLQVFVEPSEREARRTTLGELAKKIKGLNT